MTTPQQPERIGKYEILDVLGRGGMGVVYRAQDRRMGRMVAIKTVTEDFSNDASMLERFYHEAEKTGRLKHPNIVTVYDLGDQDGSPYIVMEYVDGQPLDKVIREGRMMPLLDKLRILEQVCSALGYAHQHDVIHRDVKPANVIVQTDGSAKLLDFGIAREEKRTGQGLTRTGAVIGTVPYMAPERLKGAAIDGRSDIFATGVMLFQTLTGQLPFQGDDGVLVTKLLSEKHPPLSMYLQEYPPALDHILDRALAKNPDDRYSTADEMSAEIFSVINELKREHIGDMIVQVKRLSTEQQFVQARDALMQVLKLDNQHTEARRMLADVQQHLSRKQREEQARQLSLRAEDLLRERNFEQAAELLEQAANLVPDDKLLADLLEATRKKRIVQEQVDRILRNADEARTAGDFSGAKAMVEKALQLDGQDSRVQAAYTALARQVEEAAQRARARKLIDDARDELKLRRYPQALEMLREAESVDPFHPDLAGLVNAATTGAQQEQRRKLLDEVEREVARAVTHEQAQGALVTIQAAIDKAGADPALLRLQAQVQRQVRDFEARRMVDATAREARGKLDAAPTEALQLVQTALTELPGNEQLMSLQATIEDRIASLSREERRASYLKQAHKALSEGRFGEAVEVLEGCQGELQSPEIAELLEFARNELFQDQHRRFIAQSLTDAQTMLRDQLYEEAIAYLEPLTQRMDEPALRTLLEQARRQLKELHDKAEAAAASLEPVLEAEGYEQVLAYLEMLPPQIHAQPALQAALKKAQDGLELERAQVAFLGQSYAVLGNPGQTEGWSGPQATVSAGVLGEMTRAFERRRLGLATRTITAEIEIVRAKLMTGDVQSVDELLQGKAPLVPFCTPETQTEWNSLIEQLRARKSGRPAGKTGRKR